MIKQTRLLALLNEVKRFYEAHCGPKVIFKIGRGCCPRCGVFQRLV